MKLTVYPKKLSSVWPGYWTWAEYRFLDDDGTVVAFGNIRVIALHKLTALMFKRLAPQPSPDK